MATLAALVVFQVEAMGTLIEAWRAEDPAARDRASARIVERYQEWTPADLERLKAACTDPDPEVKARATAALAAVRGEHALDRLGKLLPNLRDTLKEGSEIHQANMLSKICDLRRAGRLTEADLEVLVKMLNIHQWSAKACMIVLSSFKDSPGECGPVLRPLIEHGDPDIRYTSVKVFSRSKDDASLDMLLPLVRDPIPIIRDATLSLLAERDGSAKPGAFVFLLRDPDPSFQLLGARILRNLGDVRLAGEVTPFLRNESVQLRRWALDRLGVMGFRACADDAARLLADPDEDVRAFAAQTLGRSVAREHVERVAPLLKDPSRQVRAAAVRALGDLGSREQAPALLPLLSEGGAALSIARMGAGEHAEKLLPLLEGTYGPEATHALVLLAAEPAYRKSIAEFAAPKIRILQVALGKVTIADQRALVIETSWRPGSSLWRALLAALAQAHEPETVAALSREIAIESAIETLEHLAAALRSVGLELRFSPVERLRGRVEPGVRVHGQWLIEMLVEQTGDPGRTVVAEGRTLQVMTYAEAMVFWLKRLGP